MAQEARMEQQARMAQEAPQAQPLLRKYLELFEALAGVPDWWRYQERCSTQLLHWRNVAAAGRDRLQSRSA